MAGESASFDDQEDIANASFIKIHEHGGDEKSELYAGRIENLDRLPDQPKCCIYKVSDHIRQSNEEAYTPQVISIGPFHRDNRKFQKMEDFKRRYLESFTDQPEIKYENLVTTIKKEEERVRECYSETTSLDSDAFVKMIMLDAIFIIEFFRKTWSVSWSEYDRRILTPWLRFRVHLDLMLLENQLPFFIIEEIYKTTSLSNDHPFIELCFDQFQYYKVQKHTISDFKSVKILHFTDLVRNFCLPRPGQRRPKRNSESITLEMPSATQLAEVGLKFKVSKPNNDIIPSQLELKYADGVLEIPRFKLDDTTEIYARNLVALEECHYPEEAYITDYYTLLSFLIKTGKDVDVLVREQIVDNRLDGVVATSMINKLSEKSFYFQMNSDYHEMAKKLKKRYDNPPKFIAWRRALFRSRLIGAITISGSFLLFLTLVQCVCSVLSLKYF